MTPLPRADRLDPGVVASRGFPVARRGYDADEVRRFLARVAEELQGLSDDLAAAVARAESAEARATRPPVLDEAMLTTALGEETARVLHVAHESAAALTAKAEERASELLRSAEATVVRLGAESEAERQRAHVEGVERAAAAVAEAEARRAAVDEEVAALRNNALAEARQEAARLVGEAEAARAMVLGDLAKRRKAARTQVEQLYAARERLMASLGALRRDIEEATGDLRTAVPEAKSAADAAARRVQAEDEPSVDELEAEIEALKLAGLVLAPTPEGEPEPGPAVKPEPDAAAAEPEPETEPEVVATLERLPEHDRTGDVVIKGRASAPPRPPGQPTAALRVFRDRPDHEPEPEAEPAAERPTVLEPPSADEGVRLVPIEPVPAARPAPVVVADEPQAEPEPAPEPQLEADREPEPEVPAGEVDALFARLKANRAAQVADAVKLLERAAAPDGEPEAVAEEPEPEPEPTVADAAETAVEPEPAAEPDRAEVLARRDDAVAASITALARNLKRLLADEQNDVLDRLRRARVVAVAEVIPEAEEHAERWRSTAAADILAAAVAGAAFHGNPAPAGSIDHAPATTELVAVAAAPLRQRLIEVIERSDGDADEAADGVRAAYREWKAHRVADAAQHVVLVAFARGVFASAAEGTSLCWIADDGGTPCPDAEDNALAGAVTKGEAFPTGDTVTPAHMGCRCLLVPAP